MGLHGLLRGWLNFLYIDYVRTSQETHLWASKTCYGDIYFLYDDVRTSQKTHLWASTASYGHGFTVYMQMMPVTGIALLFMYR
jgi:hypothetical protein